ncbi:MAG: SDR family oxidoreductase [Candidatus Omnitrophota bacterium]
MAPKNMKNECPGNRKKFLLTGASGLLGSNLIYFLRRHFDILGLYHRHLIQINGAAVKGVNICDREDIRRVIVDFDPEIVVHAAALADVDKCEDQPGLAQAINVKGTQNVVDALAGLNAKLVFISTDQVYDGVKGFSKEDEPVRPINVYAKTKVEAERIVLSRPHSLVLRTNLFGWDVVKKRSLAEWCITELKKGKKINGFSDVVFSSIYTRDFANLLVGLLEENADGVFNLGSREPISKFSFLVKIAKLARLDEKSISEAFLYDAHLRAPRGKHLSMDVSKLMACLDAMIPTTEQSIKRFMTDRAAGVPGMLRKCVVPSKEHC